MVCAQKTQTALKISIWKTPLFYYRKGNQKNYQLEAKYKLKTLAYLSQRNVDIMKQIIFIKCFDMTNKNTQT